MQACRSRLKCERDMSGPRTTAMLRGRTKASGFRRSHFPTKNGAIRSLKDLAGPNGLLLVFHRSAHWCQYCRSQLVELELSRALLERNGVCVAAVSYDSPEILAAFGQKHSIGYPLLSDRASETIRSFGIFNENMAPHLKAYGVPHPVEYLVSADGIVLKKYFVPNYMNRVSGSAVALYEFSAVAEDAPIVTLKTDVLTASIGFPAMRAFPARNSAFLRSSFLTPAGTLMERLCRQGTRPPRFRSRTPTSSRQSFRLPESHNMPIPLLGETLPVYSENFEGTGTLLLKHGLPKGMIAQGSP